MDEHIDFKETGKEKNSQSGNTMILQTIDDQKQITYVKLLEIGFDNAKHLPFFFQKAEEICYYGINSSEELMKMAFLGHESKVKAGDAQFFKAKVDGMLDFQNDFFDCCFTENTLYYWKNPTSYFSEIHRVLKPGGKFTLIFIEKEFGKNLPWTQSNFTFYEVNEVKKLFRRAGFENIEEKKMTAEILSKDGQETTESFVIIAGQK